MRATRENGIRIKTDELYGWKENGANGWCPQTHLWPQQKRGPTTTSVSQPRRIPIVVSVIQQMPLTDLEHFYLRGPFKKVEQFWVEWNRAFLSNGSCKSLVSARDGANITILLMQTELVQRVTNTDVPSRGPLSLLAPSQPVRVRAIWAAPTTVLLQLRRSVQDEACLWISEVTNTSRSLRVPAYSE